MQLGGKTRDEVVCALRHKSGAELLDMICSLATVEQLFKPSEIAARTHVNKRAVLRDVRDGKFGDYYCRAENSILIPASGIHKWLARFKIPSLADN
jgi:hypothetical protein